MTKLQYAIVGEQVGNFCHPRFVDALMVAKAQIANCFDALPRRTEDLRLGEHLPERSGAALGRVRHLRVKFIAFRVAEVFRLVVLVVTYSSIGIVADPLFGAFDSFLLSLAAIDERGHYRLLGLMPELSARLLEVIIVLLMLGPWLLGDHQHPHSLLRHDIAGLGRNDRTIESLGKNLMTRLRPNTHLRNLMVLAFVREP